LPRRFETRDVQMYLNIGTLKAAAPKATILGPGRKRPKMSIISASRGKSRHHFGHFWRDFSISNTSQNCRATKYSISDDRVMPIVPQRTASQGLKMAASKTDIGVEGMMVKPMMAKTKRLMPTTQPGLFRMNAVISSMSKNTNKSTPTTVMITSITILKVLLLWVTCFRGSTGYVSGLAVACAQATHAVSFSVTAGTGLSGVDCIV